MRRPARERQIFATCKHVGEPAFTDFIMPASSDYMQNFVGNIIICSASGEDFSSLPFRYVTPMLNILNGEVCDLFGGDKHARR